uniref:Interferon-induced protein with tetratricopeptide repeats 5 n=1 Tax=Leptobrachium leishanense TaxID=445787 RepID=A0A8C5MZ06_9ANUR
MTEETLKTLLLQLNCHFTWRLLEKNAEIDEIEERLHNLLEHSLLDANRYMVYNLLAYIKHLQGNYEEAIANLDEAEKSSLANAAGVKSKLLVTYSNYAWVYYHLKQYDKSQLYIDKVNGVHEELSHTSNAKDTLPEIYGEQGWSMLKFGRLYYKKAKECYEKALKEAPKDPELNSSYATAVYRLEGLEKKCLDKNCESLDLLKRAVELNPKDSVVKALLGLTLQDLKRADEGLKYIEAALEQTPNLPYLLRYVSKFYRREGMTDKALDVLKRALSLIPNSAFHHHQIGLCYRNKIKEKKKLARTDPQNKRTYTREIQELFQKSIFHFEMTVELKKTHTYAYSDLAKIYKEANQNVKAEETFKKALNVKTISEQEKQQIHFYYGDFELHAKKCEKEAIKQYMEALLIPVTTFEKGRCEKALKRLAERKIKENPRDALGFGLLGFVHQIKKNKIDAVECYEKALELEPQNEEYLSHLCELRLAI